MLGRLVGLMLVVSIVASASVSAQAEEGLVPLTAETPLYAHGKGGTTLWMSTLQKDPDATDVTEALAFPAPADNTPRTFKLFPPLEGPMVLDPAGKIQFNLRFGSGLLANVGQVTAKLEAGTTLIATASGPANDPTASTYKDVKVSAVPKVTTITPDMGELKWTISFSGAGTAYIQVGQSSQWCQLVLPIVSYGAAAASNETANTTDNATANATTSSSSPTNTTASNATTSSSPANTTAATNQTTDASVKAAPDAEGIPSPSFVAAAVLLAGLVLARHRRRVR